MQSRLVADITVRTFAITSLATGAATHYYESFWDVVAPVNHPVNVILWPIFDHINRRCQSLYETGR